MKKVKGLFLAFMLCVVQLPAVAAITLADQASGAANFPPSSIAYTANISVGDVLFAAVVLLSSSSPGTQHVTDTVNTGNWTLLNSQEDAGSTSGIFIYWIVANAGGATPTVSVSQTSDQFGNIYIARFTGFVGTVAADSTLNGAAGQFHAASTTAVSCTPITTNFNNELLVGATAIAPGSFTGATVTNWTQVNGSTFGGPWYYAVVSTSGTNNSFSATLASAAAWQMVFGGVEGSGSTPSPIGPKFGPVAAMVLPSTRPQFCSKEHHWKKAA